MGDVWYLPFLILLLFVACLIVACGTHSSNRQLQSLTINAVGDCCETILTATGAYDAAPLTMTPVPTSWSLGTPPDTFELTTQSFAVICPLPAPASYVVTAMSPVNPNAQAAGWCRAPR